METGKHVCGERSELSVKPSELFSTETIKVSAKRFRPSAVGRESCRSAGFTIIISLCSYCELDERYFTSLIASV